MNTFLFGGVKALGYLLASVYGSGSYDGSTYNGQNVTTSSSSGGILTNTGFDIAAIITIACLIALSAVIIKVWKKPKQSSTVSK